MIGEVLKEICETRGYSGAKLARSIDKTPATISRMFNGFHNPSPRTLEDICDELRIKPIAFLILAMDLTGLTPKQKEFYIDVKEQIKQDYKLI